MVRKLVSGWCIKTLCQHTVFHNLKGVIVGIHVDIRPSIAGLADDEVPFAVGRPFQGEHFYYLRANK